MATCAKIHSFKDSLFEPLNTQVRNQFWMYLLGGWDEKCFKGWVVSWQVLSSLISKKEASMCTWCAQIANFQICKGRVGKRLCMMGLWIFLLEFGNQLTILFWLAFIDFH
jgi:hypothetical protein